MKRLILLSVSLVTLYQAVIVGYLPDFRRVPGQAPTPCPELQIGLRRDFGYSSGSGQIQGSFTIRAYGPQDLNRVIFFLDGRPMGDFVQSPFSMRFSTDSYSQGEHTFSALGYTSSGRRLDASPITAQFVTAEEGWEAGMKILGPMLGLIFGVTALMIVATVFSSGLVDRKLKDLPLGAERKYGLAGGGICPRCQRPFSRHLLSPNLVVGKLERCPFCGKISVVQHRSLHDLRAAEAAELANAGAVTGLTDPDDHLRKELDASRYQEL